MGKSIIFNTNIKENKYINVLHDDMVKGSLAVIFIVKLYDEKILDAFHVSILVRPHDDINRQFVNVLDSITTKNLSKTKILDGFLSHTFLPPLINAILTYG